MKRIFAATANPDGIVDKAVKTIVEVEIMPGIGIHLVGLADAATKETLLRVITALQSCGYSIPGKKILINVAPRSLYKCEGGLDLPIALGILKASGAVNIITEGLYFHGELGLDGSLRLTGAEDDILDWIKHGEEYDYTLVGALPDGGRDVAIDHYWGFATLSELILYLSSFYAI